MKIKRPTFLAISLTSPFLAGFIGQFFTMSSIPTWYVTLNKPIFSPPNWVFGPVWTILYLLMGIALYRVWVKPKSKYAVKVFFFHLVLNALWSIIFFGARRIGLALVVILAIWVLVYYLVKLFSKIDKPASKLLYPYLFWISFALILNFSIWLVN